MCKGICLCYVSHEMQTSCCTHFAPSQVVCLCKRCVNISYTLYEIYDLFCCCFIKESIINISQCSIRRMFGFFTSYTITSYKCQLLKNMASLWTQDMCSFPSQGSSQGIHVLSYSHTGIAMLCILQKQSLVLALFHNMYLLYFPVMLLLQEWCLVLAHLQREKQSQHLILSQILEWGESFCSMKYQLVSSSSCHTANAKPKSCRTIIDNVKIGRNSREK